MKLAPQERADLADKLWLSLESQEAVNEAWSKEIERRIRELESGSINAVSHEDVVAELHSRYGE